MPLTHGMRIALAAIIDGDDHAQWLVDEGFAQDEDEVARLVGALLLGAYAVNRAPATAEELIAVSVRAGVFMERSRSSAAVE